MDLSKLTDDQLEYLSKLPPAELERIVGPELEAAAAIPQQLVTEQAGPVSVTFEPPPPPSMAQQLGRQVGLTARGGVTGLTALPAMAGDAMNQLINMMAGTNLPPATQSIQNLMTSAGVPAPATGTERMAQDVTSAMSGVGGAAKLAKMLAPRMAAPLVENIGLQTAGAIGGATAAGLGREGGAPPLAQMGLGLLGGMVAPTGMTTAAGRTTEAGRRLVQPFTQEGRETITGEVLRQLSRDADAAMARAAEYRPQIPGYQPTTAQATRDLGLISAETAIRPLDATGRFAEQMAQANRARMTILDRLAKQADDLEQAMLKREQVTAPLREQAFDRVTVDPQTFRSAVSLTVGNVANKIANSPAGKRSTVISVVDDSIKDISRATNPRELYEIRKDLRAAERGLLDKSDRGGPNASAYKAAKNELNELIRAVDDAIESAAPGYREYLSKYASASRGIERLEAAQTFRGKVLSTTPDPMNPGQFMISQPSFARAVRALKDDKRLKGMSKAQVNALEKVGRDLDEGVLPRAVKVPGSDTFKNLSTANIIGGIIGKQMFGEMSPALQKIAFPMNWLYNGTDDRIRELIVEAMLDPKLASRLMAKASVTTMEPLSRELQRKALNMGYGATFGLGQ